MDAASIDRVAFSGHPVSMDVLVDNRRILAPKLDQVPVVIISVIVGAELVAYVCSVVCDVRDSVERVVRIRGKIPVSVRLCRKITAAIIVVEFSGVVRIDGPSRSVEAVVAIGREGPSFDRGLEKISNLVIPVVIPVVGVFQILVNMN